RGHRRGDLVGAVGTVLPAAARLGGTHTQHATGQAATDARLARGHAVFFVQRVLRRDDLDIVAGIQAHIAFGQYRRTGHGDVAVGGDGYRLPLKHRPHGVTVPVGIAGGGGLAGKRAAPGLDGLLGVVVLLLHRSQVHV